MTICAWCGKEITSAHLYQLITRPEVRLHDTCLDSIWQIALASKKLHQLIINDVREKVVA